LKKPREKHPSVQASKSWKSATPRIYNKAESLYRRGFAKNNPRISMEKMQVEPNKLMVGEIYCILVESRDFKLGRKCDAFSFSLVSTCETG
jgi:hypothetical protein